MSVLRVGVGIDLPVDRSLRLVDDRIIRIDITVKGQAAACLALAELLGDLVRLGLRDLRAGCLDRDIAVQPCNLSRHFQLALRALVAVRVLRRACVVPWCSVAFRCSLRQCPGVFRCRQLAECHRYLRHRHFASALCGVDLHRLHFLIGAYFFRQFRIIVADRNKKKYNRQQATKSVQYFLHYTHISLLLN